MASAFRCIHVTPPFSQPRLVRQTSIDVGFDDIVVPADTPHAHRTLNFASGQSAKKRIARRCPRARRIIV